MAFGRDEGLSVEPRVEALTRLVAGLLATFGRTVCTPAGGTTLGVTMGEVGVGDDIFLRTRFAFRLRIFSSSSEDVASEALASKSMLIATDSKLLRELPNEGARFRPRGKQEPANVSERLMRRTAIKIG